MKNLYLYMPEKLGTIAPEIYGYFSEHIGGVIYDGIWVGEHSSIPNIRGFRSALVEKLKQINPSVLRWPGGCFAETYDWRDGIGPRDKRPVRINWWHQNDNRYEPNEVGTDEFVDFCRLIGAQPYFAANITATTPLDIRDWIDYCNTPHGVTSYEKLREANGNPEPFNIKYWGVGNETWGGGGNMTPEVYAHEFRKYAVIMNNSAPGLELIGSGANHSDYNWTKGFMEEFSNSERHMNGFSLHYYCGSSGNPTQFSIDEWYQLLSQAASIEYCLRRHWSYICGFGMERCAKLVIDEWGTWHPDGSGPSKGYNLFEQQNTIRDAAVAALTLNIFNNNCDKIKMATIAQLINNLQSLFLSSGEHFITTPTYHVFDLYKGHQGGSAIKSTIENNEDIAFANPHNGHGNHIQKISVSASHKNNKMTVTIANLSADTSENIRLIPVGAVLDENVEIGMLNHMDYHAHNTFENPENVKAVYKKVILTDSIINVPAASVISITADIR
ncbi:MAG: alpha-L-arabinofuranosidase C-terminal domain-containing protein [Eubacteriales bacterium]|nr:alpha-L-arabinofuranosidase C-terminal domain-containing protein [Eubacteriales bacterium]